MTVYLPNPDHTIPWEGKLQGMRLRDIPRHTLEFLEREHDGKPNWLWRLPAIHAYLRMLESDDIPIDPDDESARHDGHGEVDRVFVDLIRAKCKLPPGTPCPKRTCNT